MRAQPILLTITVLLAAVPSVAQQRWERATVTSCAAADSLLGPAPVRPEARVFERRNRFRGATAFRSDPTGAGGGRWSLTGNGRGGLAVWFTYTERDEGGYAYAMHFQQIAQEWQYFRDREVNLLVDGQGMALGTADRQGEVNSSGRSVSVTEALAIPITPEQALSIARANTVEGEIGSTEFALQPRHREGLASVIRLATCAPTTEAPEGQP